MLLEFIHGLMRSLRKNSARSLEGRRRKRRLYPWIRKGAQSGLRRDYGSRRIDRSSSDLHPAPSISRFHDWTEEGDVDEEVESGIADELGDSYRDASLHVLAVNRAGDDLRFSLSPPRSLDCHCSFVMTRLLPVEMIAKCLTL